RRPLAAADSNVSRRNKTRRFRRVLLLVKKRRDAPPVPRAQRLENLFLTRRAPPGGFVLSDLRPSSPPPVPDPELYQRQRAVIESTSNTAGCHAGNVGPPPPPSTAITTDCAFRSNRRPRAHSSVSSAIGSRYFRMIFCSSSKNRKQAN